MLCSSTSLIIFKMCVVFDNSASYELRSVFRLVQAVRVREEKGGAARPTITNKPGLSYRLLRTLFHVVFTMKLCYHPFCARWVNGIGIVTFETYNKDGDSLLDGIVTGDELWVANGNCETKK